MSKVTLFSSQTANGSSPAFIPAGEGSPGFYIVTLINVWGVFDGASVQLQYLRDGGDSDTDADWYSTGDDAFTSSGSFPFSKLSANVSYRLTLSSAGGSTSIGATAYHAQTN